MRQDFTAEIMYLPEAYDRAWKLSKQITDKSGSFDIIVAIARGGFPPARMICDFLNIDTLTSLQVRHYKGVAVEKKDVEITDPVDIDIKGKNVLIIDDINDSGVTLRLAYEHVHSLNPAKVRTAVLHQKAETSFNADFTGEKLQKWKWVIYQWALTEDLLDFLNRDNMLDAGEERAIRHLADKYHLEIERELFNKVIAMKENYFPGKR